MLGVARESRELQQNRIDAFRIVDQETLQSGVLRFEPVEKLLHQGGVDLHSRRGLSEEGFQLRVVLIAGFSAVINPVAGQQIVRRLDRPCRRAGPAGFVTEGVSEVFQVQKGAGVRGFNLDKHAGHFG